MNCVVCSWSTLESQSFSASMAPWDQICCQFILVWGQNCRKGSGVCGPVTYRLSHGQSMHLGVQSAWDQSVVGRNASLPFCILICRFLSSYANPSPALSLRASLSDTFLQKDVVNQCLEFSHRTMNNRFDNISNNIIIIQNISSLICSVGGIKVSTSSFQY